MQINISGKRTGGPGGHILIILLLTGVIGLGLLMVWASITDRGAYKVEADNKIAQAWAGGQRLIGPVLAIPWTQDKEWEKDNPERKLLFIVPDNLDLDVVTDTTERRLGLHGMPVYSAGIRISASFPAVGEILKAKPRFRSADFERAVVLFGVSDPRGIVKVDALETNGNSASVASGLQEKISGNGFHAALDELNPDKKTLVNLAMTIRGSNKLELVPTALETTAQASGNWPHPSFLGSFLPSNREVGSKGFDANWNVSSLATGRGQLFSGTFQPHHPYSAMAIGFTDPHDIYALTSKALKYGILFVALTFGVCLLFEILSGKRVHPLQYGLIGSGLCLFYVLLMAFAEHIGFGPAFISSSLMILVITIGYGKAVMGSMKWAALLCGVMTILYGMLYSALMLSSATYLSGSILLFVSLSGFMWLTRNIDWYALNPEKNTAVTHPDLSGD